MAWDDDDSQYSDLAGMSRATNPLERAGYDADAIRMNPALREQVLSYIRGPYGLPQADQSTAPRAQSSGSAVNAPAMPGPQPKPAAMPGAQAGPQLVRRPAPPPAPTSAQSSPGGAATTSSPASSVPEELAGAAPGAADSNGTGASKPGGDRMSQMAMDAMEREAALGSQAQQVASDLAKSPGPDTASLDKKIAGEATPTPARDASGKVLPQYAPGVGTRIVRGLDAVRRGGVLGLADPADVGGTAYGAPNRAYQTAEAAREANLGADTTQRGNILSQFKAMTDARKQTIGNLKDAASAENDILTGVKGQEQEQANQGRNETALRKAGFKTDENGAIVPLSRDEMSAEQQAKADLDESAESLKEAQAELDRQKGNPNSPAYQQAQQRLSLAQQRLNLSTRQYLMHAYGTDGSGQPLPGAMELPDGTPVGTANAENVRPTGTQRDAAGRGQTMDALAQRIQAGLNDPDIQKYLGPVAGRMATAQARLGTLPAKVAEFYNDLKSYGAFQAGMHPVRGIGALQYFDEVMGGLAQTPEQLRGKLASNRGTAHSVEQVGTPKVAGGGGAAPPAPAAAAGGNNGQSGFDWDGEMKPLGAH